MGSSRSAPSPPTAPSSPLLSALRLSAEQLSPRRPQTTQAPLGRAAPGGLRGLGSRLVLSHLVLNPAEKTAVSGRGGCAGGRNRAEPQKGTPTGYTPQVWQKLGLRPPDTRPSAAAAFPTTSPPLPNLSIAFTLAMEGQKCGSWSLLSGGWR